MNLIQRQADEFVLLKLRGRENHKEFVNDVRHELWEYKKDIHKIEFIERIILNAKVSYDEHLVICTNKHDCPENKFYENTLFFLQQELEELEDRLTPEDFTLNDRQTINGTLQLILDELNTLKLGQELTYNDLSEEFEELKDLYYLNKRNWMQLFQGKVAEMVAGGVISETVSKGIVRILSENYEKLIVG